jgi:plastocyanin
MLMTVPAQAQSLLVRTPNLGGTWVGEPAVVHFHFMHRFMATDPPARKVLNTPTFLLAASAPGRLLAGARYATNSPLVTGYPNEWEFFGRWNPLAESTGSPLDAALHVGYNQAARSVDGELALARTIGPLRVLAAGRAFSDHARAGSRYGAAGGAALRVHEWVSFAGDVGTLFNREPEEKVAWSVGLQLRIPYSPHTVSLHASNVHTTTLQGATSSRGTDTRRWGFEFIAALPVARWLSTRSSDVAAVDAVGGDTVTINMNNQMQFLPASLRVREGQTVIWRNTSDILHTVTADPDRAARREHVQLPAGAAPFDSGDIAPGGRFSHTFTVIGEYAYVCLPHEMAGMVGRIIVEPAGR